MNLVPVNLLPRDEFDTRVLGQLVMHGPVQPWRIRARLDATPQSVTKALYRLAEAGEAERADDGTWRAI